MKVWIEAMRLRTLPLTAAGVIVAAGLAAFWSSFGWAVFIPMLLMVQALQILANFADEYGDLDHGADNDDRIGPIRGMQRGEITKESMKRAMVICSIVTVALIELLLFISFGPGNWAPILGMSALGGLAIVAAIKYTVGRGSYGYYGLGDLMSFTFFGLVAVVGGVYCYTHAIIGTVFLPAVGLGALVVAMINLNNMRDRETDQAAGKRTVAVFLGARGALVYHAICYAVGFTGFLAFSIASGITDWWRYAYAIFYIPLFMQLAGALRCTEPAQYDRFMKPHSLFTVLLSLAFALCMGL